MPQTNIVVIDLLRGTPEEWVAAFAEAGVLAVPFGRGRVRMVTHLDVSAADIEEALVRISRIIEARIA
jgi:threonine aldolase